MKHPFDVHVGSKLRHCRCVAGISRQQLGDRIGVKAAQIQSLETGAKRIDASLMRKIVAEMNVPPAMFFEGLADALSDAA